MKIRAKIRKSRNSAVTDFNITVIIKTFQYYKYKKKFLTQKTELKSKKEIVFSDTTTVNFYVVFHAESEFDVWIHRFAQNFEINWKNDLKK